MGFPSPSPHLLLLLLLLRTPYQEHSFPCHLGTGGWGGGGGGVVIVLLVTRRGEAVSTVAPRGTTGDLLPCCSQLSGARRSAYISM